MKRITFLLLALLAGCTTHRPWGVVNNTNYRLDVIQDGKLVAKLYPGGTVLLPQRNWTTFSHVSASAYASDKFQGANSYTFYWERPYLWQIDNIIKPGESK